MTEILTRFALVLTRLSAFFLVLPIFSWRAIPARIKVATLFLLSFFFAIFIPLSSPMGVPSALQLILWMLNEATYGLALGLITVLLFSVVKCSGRIIERQMGLAMAEILDPLTGDRTQPLGGLLEILFILLFFAANGHHLLLQIILRSYQAFPIGTSPSIGVLTSGVVKAGSAMLVASLKLSAPILAAFIVMLVVLAIFARIVPDMNVLFISMPVRVGLGMIMVIVFIPFLQEFVTEFAELADTLLPL
jgi:flagellar biosynthesis protein FliR